MDFLIVVFVVLFGAALLLRYVRLALVLLVLVFMPVIALLQWLTGGKLLNPRAKSAKSTRELLDEKKKREQTTAQLKEFLRNPFHYLGTNPLRSAKEKRICEGMSTSEVIEILGKPHRKTTWGEVLKDYDFVGGSLSADSPRLQDEFWLYKFAEFEYEISIRDGKVSKAKKIEKKEASNNYPHPSKLPVRERDGFRRNEESQNTDTAPQNQSPKSNKSYLYQCDNCKSSVTVIPANIQALSDIEMALCAKHNMDFTQMIKVTCSKCNQSSLVNRNNHLQRVNWLRVFLSG